MKRILALAFLAAIVAPSAQSVDNKTTAVVPEASAAQSGRELASFFDKVEKTEVTKGGMTIFRSEHNSVVVARVGSDGKMVTSCVVNEGAARAFLKVREAVSETSRVK